MRKDKAVKIPPKYDKAECIRRSEDLKAAARIFEKGDNYHMAESCLEDSRAELDKAAIVEAMESRGPIGNITTFWVYRNDDGELSIREAGTC